MESSVMENERILVPLDGSRCDENIISKVEELAIGKKEGICLLRVVSARAFPGVDPKKIFQEAEQYLQGLENRLRAKGFDVDTRIRYGDNVEEILDHAAHKEIDLIAMSTYGHRGVKRFFLGSVAEKVLQHIPKPVFLVRCN
jgi:nucleotide-binding universal stress UspA family protein